MRDCSALALWFIYVERIIARKFPRRNSREYESTRGIQDKFVRVMWKKKKKERKSLANEKYDKHDICWK